MMFSSPHNQMYPYNLSQPMQKWKPSVEIAPNCPRCNSPNTKFCYYNNYSLTQPRYFCKGCRRYWTKGGSLRNVPVGGGCRKNRRSKSSRIMSNSSVVQRRSASEPMKIRPDQALNDMVGGNSHHQSMVDDAASTTIDLAVLYNKFLNPMIEPELVPASSVSCSDQNNIELGEFGYLLDSGMYEQLAIPTTMTVGPDVFSASSEGFLQNLEWEQAPEEQQQGMDLMSQCQDIVHGNWCGLLDEYQSNFGAFSNVI